MCEWNLAPAMFSSGYASNRIFSLVKVFLQSRYVALVARRSASPLLWRDPVASRKVCVTEVATLFFRLCRCPNFDLISASVGCLLSHLT